MLFLERGNQSLQSEWKGNCGEDNSCSLLRKEDVSKAYFNCHTDITVPYKELEEISVVTNEGKDIILLEDGRFVLPGTEVLNEPLDEAGF